MAIRACGSQRFVAHDDRTVRHAEGTMAGGARQTTVHLIQCELRVALVIELQCLKTVFFTMARRAPNFGGSTKLISVRLRVTILAISSGGCAERPALHVRLLSRWMTGAALDDSVGALKFKPRRPRVIKPRRIDEIKSFRGMARRAIWHRRFQILSVQTSECSLMSIRMARIASRRSSRETTRHMILIRARNSRVR
jgi:hypothetical protein